MKTKFIITDWMNNHLHQNLEFDSFECAWGFIYENYSPDDNQYDDLFVVDKNDYTPNDRYLHLQVL